MLNLRSVALVATLAVTGATVALAPAATAKGGPGVRVSGACTHNSTSKLKLSRDNSGVQVEFEVDQNRNGVPWKVTLRKNGSIVATANARTHAPSGSFSVNRLVSGATGTFVAVATRSGESCSARAGI
jgi:hypothetical protein